MTLARKWIPDGNTTTLAVQRTADNTMETTMDNARNQRELPQEGTGSSGAGESLPGPSPGCPSFSGGGNFLPVVLLERCQSLDRLSVASDGSVSTMITVDSTEERDSPALGKFFRKRKGSRQDEDLAAVPDSGSECENMSEGSRTASPKRTRGRPPTTGQYVGLAKAKAEYLKVSEEVLRHEAEKEVALLASRAKFARAAKSLEGPRSEEQLAMDLNDRILGDVKVILDVVQKSKNLKGTCQHALKEAAASIVDAVGVLTTRRASEEMVKLQEAYRSLEAKEAKQAAELAELRKEVAELRADLLLQVRHPEVVDRPTPTATPMPVPAAAGRSGSLNPKRMAREEFPPLPQPRQTGLQKENPQMVSTERFEQAMLRMENIMLARLEAMEGRLPREERLRPPLAADRKVAQAAAKVAAAPVAQPSSVPAPQQEREKKGRKKSGKKPAGAQAAPAPVRSGNKPAEGEWILVGKNGRPKKPAKNKKKTASKKEKARKLRPPKTTAVAVTLQPGAQEKGLSYLEVLKKIKTDVKLAEIGITGIRWRKAATGAYLIELPGAASGEKADALAARIKAAVPVEGVKVSRPTRNADVRISGLDESVTPEEIIAAVAETTTCPPDQIKTNGVRPGLRGLWTSVVSCPVEAAKKLGDGRRLLIGWVSAQVKVLPPRPRKCFRCLQDGHLGVKCTCEVDCSQLCFRCSQPGHKAGGCSAEPHCAVCAAAGKPAGHRVGSRACGKPATSPKKRTRQNRGRNRGKNPSQPPTSSVITETPTTSQTVEMECQQ